MIYKVFKEKSYNLHIIKTHKFKTLFFKVNFIKDVTKENISIRNLLVDNMKYSTKKYNTRRKMNIAKADLYGAYLSSSLNRCGNKLITSFVLSILDEKYTEPNMLEKSVDLLSEVINNPNIDNNAFDEEIFNVIKKDSLETLKTLKEDPRSYSVIKLREKAFDGYPSSYRIYGYEENYKKIDAKDLYNEYQDMLKNDKIDIYVIGNLNIKRIKKLIDKKFKFNSRNKKIDNVQISYDDRKLSGNIYEENTNNKQSNLSIALMFNKKLTSYEERYVMPLFNCIFGNSPDSKLFLNVREKESLAYSISSQYRLADNFLMINAGISYKNYEKVKEKINNELNNMKKGDFDEFSILKAKKNIISIINEINSSQSSFIEYLFNINYLSYDKVRKSIRRLKTVTKNDIVKLANKIDIDTIYLLKEGIK